jgi:hypothetical protein
LWGFTFNLYVTGSTRKIATNVGSKNRHSLPINGVNAKKQIAQRRLLLPSSNLSAWVAQLSNEPKIVMMPIYSLCARELNRRRNRRQVSQAARLMRATLRLYTQGSAGKQRDLPTYLIASLVVRSKMRACTESTVCI